MKTSPPACFYFNICQLYPLTQGVEFFNDKLSALCMAWLVSVFDNFDGIRGRGFERFEAIASIVAVANGMSPEQHEEHFAGFLRRLTSRDWFTSRTSLCSLF